MAGTYIWLFPFSWWWGCGGGGGCCCIAWCICCGPPADVATAAMIKGGVDGCDEWLEEWLLLPFSWVLETEVVTDCCCCCKKVAVVLLLLPMLEDGPLEWCVLLWLLLRGWLVARGWGGGCSAVVTAKRTIIGREELTGISFKCRFRLEFSVCFACIYIQSLHKLFFIFNFIQNFLNCNIMNEWISIYIGEKKISHLICVEKFCTHTLRKDIRFTFILLCFLIGKVSWPYNQIRINNVEKIVFLC